MDEYSGEPIGKEVTGEGKGESEIEQEGQHPLTGQRAPPISGGT